MPVSAPNSCFESSKSPGWDPRGRSVGGQRDPEAAAGARLAVHTHSAAVSLDHRLDDRKAEAGAPDAALLGVVGAEEGLEDRLELVACHPDPAVRHDQRQPAVLAPKAHVNATALGRVL